MSLNPIHHHCGPFNTIKEANSLVDAACKEHDLAYGKLGKKAYFRYNDADDIFRRKMKKYERNSKLARIYGSYFKYKKMFTKPLPSNQGRVRKRYDLPWSSKPDAFLSHLPNKRIVPYAPVTRRRNTYPIYQSYYRPYGFRRGPFAKRMFKRRRYYRKRQRRRRLKRKRRYY